MAGARSPEIEGVALGVAVVRLPLIGLHPLARGGVWDGWRAGWARPAEGAGIKGLG